MRSLLIVAAWLAVGGAAQPAAPKVSDLGWLSGSWVSGSGDAWTEEMWTAPRGGVLLGLNRSGKGAKATGFEFMRIAADAEGRISFWASPGGKAAVAFPLVSLKPGEAVFENAGHDYPTKVVYRREGAKLIGTISGRGGKNPFSWTFRRSGAGKRP
jgi:hypothetical protein